MAYQVFREEDGGRRIPGRKLQILAGQHGQYGLQDLIVYQDGMIECIGLMTFERFRQVLQEGGMFRTSLPEGAGLVSRLFQAKATEVTARVEVSEFIKEIVDVLDDLNGRATSLERCMDAYRQFETDPSPGNRTKLESAYSDMPAHQRYLAYSMAGNLRAFTFFPPSKAEPRRTLGPHILQALTYLYGAGWETAMAQNFPRGTREEVEALFLAGKDREGAARMLGDAELVLSKSAGRPMLVHAVAGALSNIGEFLYRSGHIEEGLRAHLEACSLDPDSPMTVLFTARIAVERHDRDLARALHGILVERGIALPQRAIAAAMKCDVDAFNRLVATTEALL